MSISERIQLVEDIWDSLVELPEAVILTKDRKREPDNRFDAYYVNPNEDSPWEQVRERIHKRA